MRDIQSIDDFLAESVPNQSALERQLVAGIEWLMKRHGYAPDRVWVKWERMGPHSFPIGYAEMDRLSEDGPTKATGEINYSKIAEMEIQLRDRLKLRSAPDIGQYTRDMGYPDIPAGKLWVEFNGV